jgi:hypothetical protein
VQALAVVNSTMAEGQNIKTKQDEARRAALQKQKAKGVKKL